MKTNLTKFTFSLIFLLATTSLMAQMDNLANMSAKWVGANARNASLDGGDIVNYNPAGLVLIKDGIYASMNNQTLFRKPQHSFNMGAGEQTYKQDGPDYFLPSLYIAFKHHKWAVSSGIYITGGGASADYPDGSVNTALLGATYLPLINMMAGGNYYGSYSSQYIKASSYYLAVPLSFSYAITEKLGVSLGGRYLVAKNHTKAGLTFVGISSAIPDYPIAIDYENNATGFGGILGVDFAVNEKLNISAHYETKVKLKFEVENNKSSISGLAANGTKSDRDLPAVLYTGLSYKITEKFTTAIDFNYYFQKSADWDSITNTYTGEVKSASEAAGNCYAVALGLYYQLCPKLQLTAGCKYIHFNYDDIELYYTKLGAYEAVKYDNFNIGLGAAYNLTDNIQANLGLGRTFWKDKTINYAGALPVDIKNKAYVIALGIDLKF
jgi:long-chain fatty acid transport protein